MNTYLFAYTRTPGGMIFHDTIEALSAEYVVNIILATMSDNPGEILAVVRVR